jgi:RNA-directed DNA polymerase
MLKLRQVSHLARHLCVSERFLLNAAAEAASCIEDMVLLKPNPEENRSVINVIGPLRYLQDRLLTRVLTPRLIPSPFNHGSVRGRSIKTNIAEHLGAKFVFTTDITKFFPSITSNRIYRLFSQELDCSPDVARILTRLCTYRYHLALGLPTSPILADQVLRVVDVRIGTYCANAELTYTRFVDDLTISGSYDFTVEKNRIVPFVGLVMRESGFSLNAGKEHVGLVSEGATITQLRVVNGYADVQQAFVDELERQMSALVQLSKGEPFQGPYRTRSQIVGKINYVGWINPRRKGRLLRRLKGIDWSAVERQARTLGLVAHRRNQVVRAERPESA